MEERSKNKPNCLKKYRRARGLKQKEVAEILGLKYTSMISRWESGYCTPSAGNLFRLAALYRTMVDALYIDQLMAVKEDILRREEKVMGHKTSNNPDLCQKKEDWK